MIHVVSADEGRGVENLNWFKAYPELDSRQSKRQELLDFGFNDWTIQQFERSGVGRESVLGGVMDGTLVSCHKSMQRLEPSGTTRLGLYISSIRDRLESNFPDGGTVLDFGCGPWPDASASLARNGKFRVQLMDVRPLGLAFASFLLQRRHIAHTLTNVVIDGPELDAIDPGVVMIVESTAFEHVAHIRHLFGPMMALLPPGGLFLTNYTRIGSGPNRDGYVECQEFAGSAVEIAESMANRCEWDPANGEWDLWEVR